MRTPVMTAFTAVALGLAVAGCGDGDPGASPSPGTTGSATAAGPVAECVTGTWRTLQVSGQAGNAAAGGSLSGGEGATLTIGRDGAARGDFTSMQPVTFTARVAGTDVAGQFFYRGQVTGMIRTGTVTDTTAPGSTASASPSGTPTATTATTAATATATTAATATGTPGLTPSATTPTGGAGGTAGTWEPVGEIDWGTLRLTVELTRPVQARPLDNAPIGDYLDDVANRTGEVVDVDPMLGEGRYRCDGDRLVLSPDDDHGTTWTLVRA